MILVDLMLLRVSGAKALAMTYLGMFHWSGDEKGDERGLYNLMRSYIMA